MSLRTAANCGLGDLLRASGFRSLAFSPLLLAFGSGSWAPAVKSISNGSAPERIVYIVAHQDDWQLFMGDAAVESLGTGAPAIFVYLTAGDDGRDSVYWLARERAALASVRIAAGVASTRGDSADCKPVIVLEHTIRKCAIGNTDSFFLRLPDGKRNGAGFPRYDNQSMRRLRAKRIAAITAVDGSATYQDWDDLVSTVSELVGVGGLKAQVHTTDPSIVINPHDHFDHRITGLLVAELKKRRGLAVRYYVGYALSTRAANRTNAQSREKTEAFLASDQERMRSNRSWSAFREHPAFYSACMTRTYARTLEIH